MNHILQLLLTTEQRLHARIRSAFQPRTLTPSIHPQTTPMITLTTLEQHDIPGRGTVHIVAAPLTTNTLTVYTRTLVLLDDRYVQVHRVEGFCQHGLFRVGTRLGMIVRPVTAEPLPTDMLG